jgi:hypothetical protein
MDFIQNQNLSSIVESLKDININNYAEKVEFINEALGVYGKDELFSIERLVHYDWEGEKLIPESERSIQSQLNATLIARLVNNGWLDSSKFEKQTFNGLEIFIPNGNYKSAYVVLPDGQFQGLYNYLESISSTNEAEVRLVSLDLPRRIEVIENEYQAALAKTTDPDEILQIKKDYADSQEQLESLSAKVSEELKAAPEKTLEVQKTLTEFTNSLGKFSTISALANAARQLPQDAQFILMNNKLPTLPAESLNLTSQLSVIASMQQLPSYIYDLFLNTQTEINMQDFHANADSANLVYLPPENADNFISKLNWGTESIKSADDFMTRINDILATLNDKKIPAALSTKLLASFFDEIDPVKLKDLFAKNKSKIHLNDVYEILVILPENKISTFINLVKGPADSFSFNTWKLKDYLQLQIRDSAGDMAVKPDFLDRSKLFYDNFLDDKNLLESLSSNTNLATIFLIVTSLPEDRKTSFLESVSKSRMEEWIENSDQFIQYVEKFKDDIDPGLLYKIYRVLVERVEKYSFYADRDLKAALDNLHPEFELRHQYDSKLDLVENFSKKITEQIEHLKAKQSVKKEGFEGNKSAKLVLLNNVSEAIKEFKDNPTKNAGFETMLKKISVLEKESSQIGHVGTFSKIFKNASTTTRILRDFTKKADIFADKELMHVEPEARSSSRLR